MPAHAAQRPAGTGFRPKHLAWLVMVLGGMLVAWLGWHWIKRPQTFPVKDLIVEGRLAHVRPGDIKTQSRDELQKGFLWLDPAAIRQAIGKLPWVDQVMVWREWPDQVRVRVVEQKPLARWIQDNGVFLVNERGELFQVPAMDMPQNLPDLKGPAGQQENMLTQMIEWNKKYQANGVRITSLGLDARGSWRCTLNGQIHVALGRTDPFVHLENWLAVYPQIRPYLTSNAAVDLRYANGFALVNPEKKPVLGSRK